MRYGQSPDIRRRDFVRGALTAAAAAAVAARTSGSVRAADVAAGDSQRLHMDSSDPAFAGSVRPIIGTGWHGHTFPGASSPFGLVQLSQDTAGPPEPRWNGRWDVYHWDHCSGYHYPDDTVIGFSHTHLQGTGAKDLGDVLLMPVVQGANWAWDAHHPGNQHAIQTAALGPDSGWVASGGPSYTSPFSHAQEVVRAGYYGVYLQKPRVKAELTATTRCGMHRYTYARLPHGTRRGVILDLVHGLGCSVYHAELNIESAVRISGKRYTHGWAADKQVYFVIEFSKPIADYDVSVNGQVTSGLSPSPRKFTGTQVKAIFSHAPSDEPLIVRVGISCTGIEGARKNLKAEIPHWNFKKVQASVGRQWADALACLDAEFPDKALKQAFYTAAYHGMIAPATFNDVDGTYRGQDHRNHANPGFTKYTTLSIWDIYRGEFPFIMLTQPQRVGSVISTLLADYRQLNQHSLPVWPLWGNETWCMTGFHVVGMIAGAYARGFRDFDVPAVYAAMRDTALVGATANNNKALQEQFRTLGYVASAPGAQSVSRTLDFAYDYWCVGAMAQMLGHHADAAMFYKLAGNYRNLFDAKSGFMRGKLADGRWREPFRPDQEYWHDFTESDSWQATFNVMQDMPGLIHLMGGDAAFVAKLDAFFESPSRVYNSPPDISGMVGQDAQGNEPSNHIPYLYTFAGAAWKTQYWVRKVLALYQDSPNGIPGNDDCGQLSSCFSMGALGFYPVNAVTGVYVIGSPLINRAVIRNPAAKTSFTIVAHHNSAENCYIQHAKLNGTPLERSWITHEQITRGGDLVFHMGPNPNKEWAGNPEHRPPSGLIA